MDFGNILSTALATLIMLVVIHVAVFWMIRTLYPPTVRQVAPAPNPPQARVVVPEKTETFMQPPVLEQSHTIDVPTYEAPVSLEAANETGITNLDDVLKGTTG